MKRIRVKSAISLVGAPAKAPHLRVADRRRQPDALDVAAHEHRDALEQRRQVGAAVVARERVDLVDHHGLQPGQERPRVGALADHHDLERLRRGHQHVAGGGTKRPLARVRDIAVPLERRQPHHPRVAADPLLLVVQERADRAYVQRRHRRGLLSEDPRQHREDAGLGLAARGRRQHHAVGAIEHRVDGQVLDRTQRPPAEIVDDRVLEVRVQAVEASHGAQPSSRLRGFVGGSATGGAATGSGASPSGSAGSGSS